MLMPVFKRDGVAFNYLDEGDPSGGGPLSSSTASGATSPNPLASSRPRRASDCSHWTAAATGERARSAPRTSSPSRPSPTTSRR
jgi:hypothetical protein